MTRLLTLLLAALLVLSPVPWDVLYGAPGTAWADDDDGDDGDDDDDDDSGGSQRSGGGGGGGSGSGRGSGDGGGGGMRSDTVGDGNDPVSRFLRRLITGNPEQQSARPNRPAPPRAPQTSPLPVARPVFPDNAPDEIIVFDLAPDDLAALIAQGFTELASQPLPGLGAVLHRLQIAPDLTLAAARTTVQALPSGGAADFNHFYRSEQGPPACSGPHCRARATVDWPVLDTCPPPSAIGMIDTAVNPEVAAFAGAALQVYRVADAGLDMSDASHGTAVAALLVGAPDSRTPGLVPPAPLIAVDAFHRSGRDERADAVALLQGLSLLAEAEVSVINLSLAGPPNVLLERAVRQLVAHNGIAITAAVGNGGPQAAAAYPAAYAPVIAVTAVDTGGQIYRRAQQGPHVDLAAPGIEVWTAASISGARPRTGTSFATPFVTAALAILRAHDPDADPGAMLELLAGTARDLGDPGRDAVFGHGLISGSDLCATEAIFRAATNPGDK